VSGLRLRFVTRGALIRLAMLLGALVLLATCVWNRHFGMPGRSRPVGPPDEEQPPDLAGELERDLTILAEEIGARHVGRPASLRRAKEWIAAELTAAGWPVREESYEADGVTVANLVAERRGTTKADEILIVGAHYDTVPGCPGANDNGTGVVGLLALARRWADLEPGRTLRLVTFVNEEPPYFQTDEMGSVVHAKGCRERGEKVVGVVVLETMGCFSDEKGSQEFPVPLLQRVYGDTGNFIAFVGSSASGKFLRQAIGRFRAHATIPSEGAALPGFVPGIGWSDHWSFEREGYPAFMITDTAPFRYEHYHRGTDTVNRIDFPRLAKVIEGLTKTVPELLEE
jgi:hypothetical protein